MSDVTLSASVRQSLLSLQSTTDLISRTQNRLSTGLRVSSAIDDPVAFFQGKSLSDRASDFLEKKDSIDQGISTVTGALDGVDAIESLVQQMKGISNSMKSATNAQIQDLVQQFNDLRTQIDNLAADASYQGTNLINGTGQTLSVEFSEQSSSLLNVSSVNIRSETAGLNISRNAGLTADDSVTHGQIQNSTTSGSFRGFLSAGASFTLTYAASDNTFNAGDTIAFTYGTGTSINLRVATGQALTVTQNSALTVSVVTSTTGISSTGLGLIADLDNINLSLTQTAAVLTATSAGPGDSTLVTYNGTTNVTLTSADSVVFTFGTGSNTLRINAGQTLTLTAGEALTISVINIAANTSQVTGAAYVVRGSGTGAAADDITAAVTGAAFVKGVRIFTSQISANGGEISFTGLVRAGDTTQINAVIDQLDNALTTLRTQAQTLGSNVALLNARLSFTESYVNTLQGGADKLTLADINSEGANLLALQTRQQLGIQSLSLAAQAEASILSLFG